ncbi:MAG: RidA family protein [Candidatus Zixiibacteriota bacterium]
MDDIRMVTTAEAPGAVGPYSPAIHFGGGALVFLSGQIPLDPRTGQMVPGGVAEQTERALANMRALLEAAGSGMDRVLKTTVFLIDMNDFAAMNEVYARHFPGVTPARSTIQVGRLPKDARVEIEAVAACGGF